MKTDKRKLGDLGEQIAVQYLREKGYPILERNYISKLGEIDIIAAINKDIYFIEVKTRTRNDYGLPQEAVNQAKQRKIIKTAIAYLKSEGYSDYNCRFDIISVLMDKNNHPQSIDFIENAFSPPDYYAF